VLLTVDTLRADAVLDRDARTVRTPAIDALLSDSVVFTEARSAAPWTKPALASLLTGLSPLVHGTTNRRALLPEEAETLAERLRANGYRTSGVGLNAHLERAFHFDQGFDDYAFPARLDHGIALGARVLARVWPERRVELFPSSTAIADVAIEWMRGHAREPFFLWVHLLDPHWPYEPPPEWLSDPLREPRRWGDPAMVTAVQAGNTKLGPAEKERVRQLYDGEVRYVDAQIERLATALKSLGLYERALLVFASDHGEEFWEHGRYEHGHTLYDELLHVPLAFKLPGAAQHRTVAAPVSTEALVPTVLDVLGMPYEPARLSGRSLVPLWEAADGAERAYTLTDDDAVFATGTYYFGDKRGVVFAGRKLVLSVDTGVVELYDLASDPRELASIASSAPADVERGLQLLEDWRDRSLALRKLLGIAAEPSGDTDHALARRLRSLGYAGGDGPGSTPD
jgi:arylsulfatase A-like enzyme